MNMLDALRHLVLIVEHGTFTEAARHAHLSQPALTASIQRLEEDVGARLLHRGRRGASLSAAGEALMPSARAALAAVEEGRRAVREVEGLHAGEVRLGAGATACTYMLPKVIARFRRKHPGVRFLLRETTTEEAREGLRQGELDLVIISALAGEEPEGELWKNDELILIASPRMDAKRAPYLTFRPGATTRALFERFFPDVEVVMELGSIATVKGNVRAGIGKALVSRDAVREDLQRGRLVRVKDRRTPIVRELRIVHRGLDRLSPSAAALREALLR